MCIECRQSPCSSGCPNCEPEKRVFTCRGCGDGIYKGDKYMTISGEKYHADCVNDLSPLVILQRHFGARMEIAGED